MVNKLSAFKDGLVKSAEQRRQNTTKNKPNHMPIIMVSPLKKVEESASEKSSFLKVVPKKKSSVKSFRGKIIKQDSESEEMVVQDSPNIEVMQLVNNKDEILASYISEQRKLIGFHTQLTRNFIDDREQQEEESELESDSMGSSDLDGSEDRDAVDNVNISSPDIGNIIHQHNQPAVSSAEQAASKNGSQMSEDPQSPHSKALEQESRQTMSRRNSNMNQSETTQSMVTGSAKSRNTQ